MVWYGMVGIAVALRMHCGCILVPLFLLGFSPTLVSRLLRGVRVFLTKIEFSLHTLVPKPVVSDLDFPLIDQRQKRSLEGRNGRSTLTGKALIIPLHRTLILVHEAHQSDVNPGLDC